MSKEILTTIQSPDDLRDLTVEELKQVADELRKYIIPTITEVGGHLASTLGAVELTLALHYVYDTPEDKIVWDVGHQGYAHKVLTGRYDALKTIRQYGGLSGFLKRSESDYDVFGAGHASTSISAALGIACARDHNNEDFNVVSIIGDGSMTGGLAYEGINNAGHLRKQLLVILNDNDMSISPNVGSLSTLLNRVVTNPVYNRIRDEIWKFTGSLPFGKTLTRKGLRKLEESLKNLVSPGIVFDELGLRYFGPVDGHNLEELIRTLNNLKNIKTPVLLHVLTKKGKGMRLAEVDPVTFHGVSGSSGKKKDTVSPKSFQDVFGTVVTEIAQNRDDTVCISAAMREGTGLVEFDKKYPDRFYDVGIAEGHAVTFAGGMATENVRPIVAIYSTFLQRAFDHIFHDIALQNLPVIFCLDRAGVVGEDGPTHHGALDIVYLRCIQNLIVTAPRNGNELRHLMYTALNQSSRPFAIRYPKGDSVQFEQQGQAELIPIGSWDILRKGNDVAILAVGPQTYDAMEAADYLKRSGISCEVINCRFIKPMDDAVLESVYKRFNKIVTIEEGVIDGGFGDSVSSWMAEKGFNGKIKRLGLPNEYVTHGSRGRLLKELRLTSDGIVTAVQEISKG